MKPDRLTRDYAGASGPTVADLRRGALARVIRVIGGRAMAQRARMVGIRPGVEVCVLHGPDRMGAVLDVGGARIALGHAVLPAILVARTGTDESPADHRR